MNRVLHIFLISFLLWSCGKSNVSSEKDENSNSQITENKRDTASVGDNKDNKIVIAPKKVVIKDPILFCEKGECKIIDKSEVTKNNYSIIDLSNNFTPFVFSEKDSNEDTPVQNNYRKTYIALENDKSDEDGRKLKPNEHNYLELYGISPSLSVLQERFIRSVTEKCAVNANVDIFKKLNSNLVYSDSNHKKYYKRFKYAQRTFKRWARRKNIKNIESYLKNIKGRPHRQVRRYLKAKRKYEAFLELQKRLVCELIISQKKIRKNSFNLNMKKAIRGFERKHMIFGWGFVNKKVRKFLARTMLENNYLALKRMVRERVAHSLAIFEDGTVRNQYSKGKKLNLIRDMKNKTLEAMGLTSPKKALAFFKKHKSKDFEDFKVAVKLPKLPEYYSDNMEFYVRHSIGDVWYDVPYTPDGKRKSQPRSSLPHLYLYAVYKGRQIPLTRLGTTSGGWQKEFAQGKEFLKYKSSDLGKKEWKFMVAAPVWFPPATTPPRELITYKRIRGRLRAVPRMKSFGPSYASAYGLAMAIHTHSRHRRNGKIEDLDHGIRTHGSVNYMSIRVGHSHGCHRLHNHLALRLFSNILRRHKHKRLGQQPADWSHFFYFDGKTRKIHLTTKGYYYELEPPIPIRVGRGAILGSQKRPIKDLIRIPGKTYPPDMEIGMEIAPDGSLQPAGTVDATQENDQNEVPSALPTTDGTPSGTTSGTGTGTGTGTGVKTPPKTIPKIPKNSPKKTTPPKKVLKTKLKTPTKLSPAPKKNKK